MIDKIREKSARGCPSQCPKGPTQVSKTGVLIPVKLWNRKCGCRYFSKGDGDSGFAWSYARGMSLSNEGLGVAPICLR